MRFKPSVAFGYLVLLLSSLGVPVLHYYLADKAIEHTRMATGLLPAHMLFWRWFEKFSWALPVVAIAFLLLSLRYNQFTRMTTLFALATVQLVFITLYGVYCAFLLSHLLLD